MGYFNKNVANLGREVTRRFERDRIRHGCSYPERAFVEMGHKLSANKRDQQERGGENHDGAEQGRLGAIEAPLELHRVSIR